MANIIIIEKICPICKKKFSVERRNNRRYCTRKCMLIGSDIRKKEKLAGKYKLDIRQPITAINENGYEILRAEIIKQAIKDYKKSLKGGIVSAKSFEKFFLSRWGQFLSGGNGERIVNYCKYGVLK